MTRMTTGIITRMRADCIGAILCGGLSTRMRRDKGLIADDGMPWAARAAQLLKQFVSRAVYSIHPRQREEYVVALPGGFFVEDLTRYQDIGPLGGLLSVHAAFPGLGIFLLACDMQAITAADIRPVISADADIAAYRVGGIFEPLCAYYSAVALREIARGFEAGEAPLGLQKILALPGQQVTALTPVAPQRLTSLNGDNGR